MCEKLVILLGVCAGSLPGLLTISLFARAEYQESYFKTGRLAMLNNPLVEQIYDSRESLYKDLRPLNSVAKLDKRAKEVRRLMGKTSRETRTYKKLAVESRLIAYKRAVYADTEPVMLLTRLDLQLTDKQSWEGKEDAETKAREKKKHTVPLLNLVHALESEERLRAILASIDTTGFLCEGSGRSTPVNL
jgi:hypothetical protein